MSDPTDSHFIVIRPRAVPAGSSRWKDWVSRPEGQGPQLALGYLLGALAVLLGIGLIVVYTMAKGPHGESPGACLMGLLAAGGGLLYSLFRHAKRYRLPHALQALEKDARPPIILLRSFRDDSQRLPEFRDRGLGLLTFGQREEKTFEEFLHQTFSGCGPVLTIGRPGEPLPLLGAARFWVSDAKWKEVVNELLQEAQYVVMVIGDLRPEERSSAEAKAGRYFAAQEGNGPSDPPAEPADDPWSRFCASLQESDPETYSPEVGTGEQPPEEDAGLVWEAKQLFGLQDGRKVILVMPPVEETEALRRWKQYREHSQDRLPTYEGGEMAATFDAGGACRVARAEKRGLFTKSYKRNLAAYQSALVVLRN